MFYLTVRTLSKLSSLLYNTTLLFFIFFYDKTKEKNKPLDLQCLKIFQFAKSAVRQGCNKIHVKLPAISKKRAAQEKDERPCNHF